MQLAIIRHTLAFVFSKEARSQAQRKKRQGNCS
jgi:hypothetical protein